MARTIIVDGGEKIACPKCNHGFPLSEGISRQTIERYAEDFERSVAAHRRKLEAELAAEAKAQFDSQRKALNEELQLSLEGQQSNPTPVDGILTATTRKSGVGILKKVRAPPEHCGGPLIWAAKQTKAWHPAWLRNLEDDHATIGAEMAVIVT